MVFIFNIYSVESDVTAAGLLKHLERVNIVMRITSIGGCQLYSRIDKRIDRVHHHNSVLRRIRLYCGYFFVFPFHLNLGRNAV